MLLGKFFTVSEKHISGNHFSATIDINALHPIFEGHFPGQPVVPGVCMLQMIAELFETAIGNKVQLQKADFLKFLAVINPLETPSVQVEFSFDEKEPAGFLLNGRIFRDTVNFLKFKASFSGHNHDLVNERPT